jgi:diadenosine tetraphosphate (Ap4A) HIT family hydrolase
MTCPLCERADLLKRGAYPYLISEFQHSWLLLGEHQFFPGYCVLLSKLHYREMSEVAEPDGSELFRELMTSSRAIEKTFAPSKMNLCSLGNVVPHLHWHLFPRFESDPGFKWLRMHLFEGARVGPSERDTLIARIRSNI